ncbi:MAG: macrolide transporter subunit MacA [Polyangiales bacterium]
MVAIAVIVVKRSGAKPAQIDDNFVIEVKRGALEIEIIETGKIQPREKVELKSKVSGQVEAVFVEEGQLVKKGQLLLKLDPVDYKREVAHADADVAQARNALAFAKITLERRKLGMEGQVTSKMELDSAENDVRVRQVALTTAAVSLGAAQDRLRYTQIFAPLDGTVIQRGVNPGEVVVPGVQATFDGKSLLTVADVSTLIVKVDLNQIDVAKVRLDQTAILSLDALPGKTYEATVTKVAPASIKPVGKDVEVFPVEARLTSADAAIKPGMTADVRIRIATKGDALHLPIEAVIKDNAKSFVHRVIVKNKKRDIEKVEVTVGARNDREIEVLTGIAEHDRILIKPPVADNELKL